MSKWTLATAVDTPQVPDVRSSTRGTEMPPPIVAELDDLTRSGVTRRRRLARVGARENLWKHK